MNECTNDQTEQCVLRCFFLRLPVVSTTVRKTKNERMVVRGVEVHLGWGIFALMMVTTQHVTRMTNRHNEDRLTDRPNMRLFHASLTNQKAIILPTRHNHTETTTGTSPFLFFSRVVDDLELDSPSNDERIGPGVLSC